MPVLLASVYTPWGLSCPAASFMSQVCIHSDYLSRSLQPFYVQSSLFSFVNQLTEEHYVMVPLTLFFFILVSF